MQKVISLTVHRNTRDKRRRKAIRSDLLKMAKEMDDDAQMEGFFMVAWKKDRSYRVRSSDPEGVIGLNNMPGFVGGAATRMVGDMDREE